MNFIHMVRWLQTPALIPIVSAMVALAMSATPVSSQTHSGTIVGVVTSLPSRQPLGGARVEIAGTDRRATTDSTGSFRIGGLPGGSFTVEMRAIGYEAVAVAVSIVAGGTARLDLAFTPIVVALPGVSVDGSSLDPRDMRLQGFYQRKAAGFGRFITRQDIVDRDPRDSKELFRGIPGVRVVGNRLQMTTGQTRRCVVQYFVDGLHMSQLASDVLAEFRPRDVEGIEIYRGPAETPAAFSRGGAECGTVVIWTRGPGNR
jgi:hypothetical protein